MKHEFSQQIFEKISNIKFHQNPSTGSPADRQTDMKKLKVAFRNFANAPKVCLLHSSSTFVKLL
jgi:hypothetical protein